MCLKAPCKIWGRGENSCRTGQSQHNPWRWGLGDWSVFQFIVPLWVQESPTLMAPNIALLRLVTYCTPKLWSTICNARSHGICSGIEKDCRTVVHRFCPDSFKGVKFHRLCSGGEVSQAQGLCAQLIQMQHGVQSNCDKSQGNLQSFLDNCRVHRHQNRQ